MKTYEAIYIKLKQATDYLSGEQLAQELDISRTSVWKGIQQLEKRGLTIEGHRTKGYKLLLGDLLFPHQIERQVGIPVHLITSSHSTQFDAKKGIEEEHPAPALYLAHQQSGAHGRFGRHFFTSPTGGIYMSLHLSPSTSFQDLPPYTLLVAAAMVKAIANLTGIQVQIKWVNDIYLGKKKIAGILTEAISSIETQTVTDVIIGVGINFHLPAFPPELLDKAGNLFEATPPITRNQLISELWSVFLKTDPTELLALYKEKSLVLGKEVYFQEAGKVYRGIAKDLTPTGELMIKLDSGQEKILSSGEISLSSWGDHS